MFREIVPLYTANFVFDYDLTTTVVPTNLPMPRGFGQQRPTGSAWPMVAPIDW